MNAKLFLVLFIDACDIYTWGLSTKGTLGHGEEEEELVPRVVEALLGRDIRKLACGHEHTLAVTGILLTLQHIYPRYSLFKYSEMLFMRVLQPCF